MIAASYPGIPFPAIGAEDTHSLRPLVLYHKGCPDGFGAAWAAYKALGQGADYRPMSYGDELPNMSPRLKVYMLDWSAPPDELESWLEYYDTTEVVIIDHHVTAVKDYAGFDHPRVKTVFDLDQSGAVLAWRHFRPEENIPIFLLYVQDRDLWRWKRESSKEVNAALFSYPRDFDTWEVISHMPIEKLMHEGAHIVRRDRVLVEEIAEFAYPAKLEVRADQGIVHLTAAAVNMAYPLVSDTLHYLLDKYPEVELAVAYRFHNHKWYFSLRARDEDALDVSEIARRFGGGGHPKAAGFETTKPPLAFLLPADFAPISE